MVSKEYMIFIGIFEGIKVTAYFCFEGK